MLRALSDCTICIMLCTTDQSAQAVILEDIGREQISVFIIIAQPCKNTLGIIGIFDSFSSIIVNYFRQSVKVIIGVADRIAVAVGHGGQVAALWLVGIACKRCTAHRNRCGLSPGVIGKAINLRLRRTATVARARERRELTAGIGIGDRGDGIARVLQHGLRGAACVVIGILGGRFCDLVAACVRDLDRCALQSFIVRAVAVLHKLFALTVPRIIKIGINHSVEILCFIIIYISIATPFKPLNK